MSNADSQLTEDYQCDQEQLSHRNTNYTLCVIMRRYTKKERPERKQRAQLKADEWIHSVTSALRSATSRGITAS